MCLPVAPGGGWQKDWEASRGDLHLLQAVGLERKASRLPAPQPSPAEASLAVLACFLPPAGIQQGWQGSSILL